MEWLLTFAGVIGVGIIAFLLVTTMMSFFDYMEDGKRLWLPIVLFLLFAASVATFAWVVSIVGEPR